MYFAPCYNSFEVNYSMKYLGNIIRIIFLVLFVFLFLEGNIQTWFKIFAFSLILAIIFGRFFCGYICPMNTLMIYTEKISKKLGIQRNKIPEFLKWKHLQLVVFLITIGIMIFSKRFLDKDVPLIMVFLFLSVFLTIFFKQELFHNHICPFGFLQRIFGRSSYYSHKVDLNKCIGCKICERSCPTSAIKVKETRKAEINKSLCLQCGNCLQVCPKDAISYTN